MKPGIFIAVLLFAGVFLPFAAQAQSVCVSCERPDAAYKCVLKLPEGVAAPSRGRKLMQLACIEDIAKRYGHEQCKVRRGVVGPCVGIEHALNIGGSATGTPSTAGTPPASPPVAGASPPPTAGTGGPPKKNGNSGPPKTVVELAERAGEDSQRQLKKAGKAVEGAMQKTWRCITSFFGNC